MSVRFSFNRVSIGRAIGLAIVLAFSAPRADACDLVLTDSSPAVRIQYDPFAAVPDVAAIRFTLHNRSDEGCRRTVALRDTTDQPQAVFRLGEPALSVQVQAIGNRLAPSVEPGVFSLTLAAEETVELELGLVIVEGSMVQAGVYDIDAALSVWGDDAAPPPLTKPLRLSVVVAPRAQLNLAGAAGDFGAGTVSRIDFGEAASDAVRRLFLQVRANAASRLTIASQNGGKLLRTPAPDDRPDQYEARPWLPYSLALNDQPVVLSDTATIDVDPPRTYQGQSMEMILRLGEIPPSPPGVYEDLITIEVRTL